jgi:uncharacterized protein involved in exopolysaccharide biosynthesis
MESINQFSSDQDEINLQDLFNTLWRGKWLVSLVTIACGLVALIAVWLTPKKYEAFVVISPASEASGNGQLGGLSSLASQFGGLASLAGISIPNDTKRAESLAVLESQALTEKYISDNDLLPVLFHKKWNPEERAWEDSRPSKVPTLWQANEYFKKGIRSVASEGRSGLVTLTITWDDATTAAKWANGLVKATNDYLRTKAITESERNIGYLNDQAARTNVVEARQAIYSILRNEINKVMLARGNEEYAFKIIDPAVAPEKASSPKPVIWLFMGLFIGLALSTCVAFVLYGARSA